MLQIVFVLAFVSLSQQCCTPPVWEGNQDSLVTLLDQGQTKPKLVTGNYKVYYDAGRKMIAVYGTTNVAGTQYITTTIQNYNTRIQYNINNGTCATEQLPVFPGNCFPDNATRIDTYMGTGSQTMPIQIYQYPQNGLQISMSVDSNCVPTGQTFYGTQNNQRMFGSTGFMDVVGRQSLAASVFSIPRSCVSGNSPNVFGR